MKNFRDIYYNIRKDHHHTLTFLNSSIAFIDIANVQKRLKKSGEHTYDKFLTEWEHSYIESLKIPKRKIDFLCGRLAGKRAVKRHLVRNNNMSETDRHSLFKNIEIRRSVTGRPVVFIKDGKGRNGSSEYYVSISHTEGVAASLVADKLSCRGIGIDIEKIDDRDPALIDVAFTDAEKKRLNNGHESGSDLYNENIARHWSIKEAVMKSMGVGVNIDLRDIEVTETNNYASKIQLRNKAIDRFNLLEGVDLKVESARIRKFMVSIACLY